MINNEFFLDLPRLIERLNPCEILGQKHSFLAAGRIQIQRFPTCSNRLIISST